MEQPLPASIVAVVTRRCVCSAYLKNDEFMLVIPIRVMWDPSGKVTVVLPPEVTADATTVAVRPTLGFV